MRKSKRVIRLLLIMMLAVFLFNVHGTTNVQAAKLPKKLYKLVKGKWYTQYSSGGYNIKFTKTRVKYYSRQTNKLVYSGNIKKVKKIKSGNYKGCYRIIYKNANGTSSFINSDKKATAFDYYDGAKGYSRYSGSSSIYRGKW